MSVYTADLIALRDEGYAAFQSGLIPTIPLETVIGVRMPQLRSYAKDLFRSGGYEDFLSGLPHFYYEENNLHGLLLCQIRDFEQCVAAVDRFLPWVDNWATCDLLRPSCFREHKVKLLPWIRKWLASDHPYAVRFGIEMLMVHFLQDSFRPMYLKWVSDIYSNEYYVNMMIAWYFATALSFQYEAAVVYLEQHKMPVWVHNKTVQKAVESFRIPEDRKAYLRTLRRKGR